MVCSCPGPQPRQNGNLLQGGGLEIIFRLFLPWLTRSHCPHSVFNATTSLIAQALAACNSTLRFSSGRLPMSQCSSELGVLQTVCGLLMGLNHGCKLQNKESLVASQTSLCALSVSYLKKKVLLVTTLHHIFIRTLLFTDTPRLFLELFLVPHLLPIVSRISHRN